MNIGERINHLRKTNNLSQEELAEKLHVSRQTVSRWENNSSQPDIDSILAISNLFMVSTDYILGKEEEIISKDNNNIFFISFGIIIIGMVFPLFYFFSNKNTLLLAIGIGIQIIGVIYFEVKNNSKKEKYRFYSKSTWLLTVSVMGIIHYFFYYALAMKFFKILEKFNLLDILYIINAIDIKLASLTILIIYIITNIIIIKILKKRKSSNSFLD